MTFCLMFDLPSRELYDAAHAELSSLPTGEMLLHLARPTDDGVQVVEVWTSAGAFQDWMTTVGGPALGKLAEAGWALPEVTPAPFEPAGPILPGAGIAV
jgi:hypothetical protein